MTDGAPTKDPFAGTKDPRTIPYREREQSVTLERLDEPEAPVYGTEIETQTELFTINIGPHHPATHGVLRLLTTLEGEIVRDVTPIIGYLHTGIEKSCEDQQYWKVIPFVERMDYLSYYGNSMVFCMAVERLLDLEVPARAQYLRVIHLELNRIASHLFWLPPAPLGPGGVTVPWWGVRARPGRCHVPVVGHPRARPGSRPVRDVQRSAAAHALLPGRRRLRGHPA